VHVWISYNLVFIVMLFIRRETCYCKMKKTRMGENRFYFVYCKVIYRRKLLFKFFYIYLLLEKLVNGKYFPVKRKFNFVFRKMFYFYFGRKHFSEVVKNLKISYYLLIISNLILKLLIVIYVYCYEYLFFNFTP